MICSPTVKTGLKLVNGSCGTKVMARPRIVWLTDAGSAVSRSVAAEARPGRR